MLHQWEKPFLLDHSATTERFGIEPTGWEQILTEELRDRGRPTLV
ncbi:hypothetical protein [Nesterenkonia alkaliphila]|nr:hypothetical protein [Nesterenkonia alkaliphila]